MNSTLRLTLLFLGAGFVIEVFYLLVKKRISERNSFLWLAGALVILLLSVIPEILENIAHFTGVDYPPTLLFLVAILVILFIVLHQSIQLSILQDRCRELAQHLALIQYRGTGRAEQGDLRVAAGKEETDQGVLITEDHIR